MDTSKRHELLLCVPRDQHTNIRRSCGGVTFCFLILYLELWSFTVHGKARMDVHNRLIEIQKAHAENPEVSLEVHIVEAVREWEHIHVLSTKSFE